MREVYERAYRRTNFTFTDGRHEYTRHLINVTFKYSVKEFNKINHHCYMKLGYRYDPEKFTDCLWVEDGELIGVITKTPVESCQHSELWEKHFFYNSNTGCYECKENFKTIMSTADLRRYLYKNSFLCDGISFVRYKRSSGSSRVGKCLFIDEKMYSRMHRWDKCGLPIRKGQKVDLAALESYISLTLSSIIDTITLYPENILLIDDCSDVFTADVVATKVENKRLVTGEEEIEISNKIWDGQSLLDSSVFEEAGYTDCGMLLLRNRMFKSCCFNTNLQTFFEDYGITSVEQLNGYTAATALDEIKLITTPSSIKYLKFGSFEQWLRNLSSTFGVVKHEKPTHYYDGELVQTHYQLLNTLQMTPAEVEDFLQPTIQYIENIKTDPAYLKLHIKYTPTELFPKPYLSTSDIVYDMMGVNEDFCRTKWYATFRANIVRKLIKEMKSGKVLVHGNYSTLFGNPVEMLLESIGQFDGESRIGIGNIHSHYFPYGQKILGSRSPHVTIGNILLTQNTANEEIDRYFNLSNEIVCINSIGEPILDRLSGADFDSDTIMLTDNEILIQAAERNYENFKVPANLVQSKKMKRYYTPDEQADLDIKTSVNKIGEIINLSQELNSLLWDRLNNGAALEDVRDLYYDICQLDVMSNLEIDMAKKEFDIDNAAELRALQKKYTRRDKDKKTIKPYFFAHVARGKGYYDKEHKKYQKMDTTMDYLQTVANQVHIKLPYREKHIDFLDCIRLEDFDIRRVKYNQLYRVIDRGYRYSEEVRRIWATEKYSYDYKVELAREARIQCSDYINGIRMNPHTMFWLLTNIERSDYARIKRSLMTIIFMDANSSFFNLVKQSGTTMPILVPDPYGECSVFHLKFRKDSYNYLHKHSILSQKRPIFPEHFWQIA